MTGSTPLRVKLRRLQLSTRQALRLGLGLLLLPTLALAEVPAAEPVVSLLADAFRPTSERSYKPLPTVASEEVRLTRTERPIRSSGQIIARSEQTLAFKLSAPLARIEVREGERFKAGQLLAILNLNEVDARISQARSRRDEAARQLQRLQTLQARQLVAAQQVDAAQTALSLAEDELRLIGINRQQAEIRAPGDGRVLKRLAEPNEMLAPMQPVLVIALDSDGWALRVGLSDREIVQVQPGDPAEIQFDAYPGQTFTGTVGEIAATAHPQTGTYAVDIHLAPQPLRLFAGFTGRVTLHPRNLPARASVPVDALTWADNQQGQLLRILDDGTLTSVPVRLGAVAGERVEVLDGLQPGWRIVSGQTDHLREGVQVHFASEQLYGQAR